MRRAAADFLQMVLAEYLFCGTLCLVSSCCQRRVVINSYYNVITWIYNTKYIEECILNGSNCSRTWYLYDKLLSTIAPLLLLHAVLLLAVEEIVLSSGIKYIIISL